MVLIDDRGISLEDSFAKWRPKLVASWTSTGLATTLDFGAIPICFCHHQEKHYRWPMIYPMRNRVLFWPVDKILIENTVQVEEVYYTQLNNLRNYRDLALFAE